MGLPGAFYCGRADQLDRFNPHRRPDLLSLRRPDAVLDAAEGRRTQNRPRPPRDVASFSSIFLLSPVHFVIKTGEDWTFHFFQDEQMVKKTSLGTIRQKISAFPRKDLIHRPTPLRRLHRLTQELGGPEIWIKRDDLTGLGLRGDKPREARILL